MTNTTEYCTENLAENDSDINANGNEKISKKQAFKIKPHKGVKLTESIKKELKNKNGCRLDSQIHNAYICPIGSKKDIENLFNENNIKADLIDVIDFFPNKSKKVVSLENQIEYLQKKIISDENLLLVDVHKYDKHRSVIDFEELPILEILQRENQKKKKLSLLY